MKRYSPAPALYLQDRNTNVNQDNFDFYVRGELVGCPYFHYKLEAANAEGFRKARFD
jgi:hypothetical protein